MRLQDCYIEALGLSKRGDTSYEYVFEKKEFSIIIYESDGRFVIIGKYLYYPDLEPVRQTSYIDLESLENFAMLAMDDIGQTTFKLFVIDRIMERLIEKAVKLIQIN